MQTTELRTIETLRAIEVNASKVEFKPVKIGQVMKVTFTVEGKKFPVYTDAATSMAFTKELMMQ
jgi:hypothetical protein